MSDPLNPIDGSIHAMLDKLALDKGESEDSIIVQGGGTQVFFLVQGITIGAPQDGDANGDGRLNEADVLHALRMYVKLEPQDLTADMNGSGSVTPDDARIILQQAAQRRG